MEVNNSVFWDIAYRDNAPALLGVLRRYVRDVSIAQDLLHEVFITAIDKYDSYTGKGSFEGWLYRITTNTALTYLRNERNRQVSAEAILSVMDDENTDNEHVDEARAIIEAAGFSGEELLAVIDRLPEHHKLVFNMYVMDDFSHKQIGTELHISPGTSKSHLARARKKIQQILYEDALNRKKKKDRRWASAFLLLFPAKRHYIDRLYRDGLSGFKIPPTGGAEFISTALEQHTASVASTAASSVTSGITQSTMSTATFWGGKLSYIAACCSTAAITGSVCWLSMSDNSPLNSNSDLMNRDNDMVTVSDTLMYLPKPTEDDHVVFDIVEQDSLSTLPKLVTTIENPDPVEHHPSDDFVSSNEPISSDSSAKETEPVIIKKQIIQHQTVVVRDTIFIIENE